MGVDGRRKRISREGSQEEGVQYVVVSEWNNDSAAVVLSSCSSYREEAGY